MTERTFFTKADCVSFEPVEAYSIEKQKDRFTTVATTIEDARNVILEAPRWLPVAAESYNISPNIKDYVLVPVIAIVSDLPNRNGHAFSRKTLASWTMDRKQVMAHTFTGCPTHVEHCFPKNTSIRTKDGYKDISSIKVGDRVLTHKNRYRKVVKTFNNGNKWLSEIKCSGLDSPLYVTENHPLWVIGGQQIYDYSEFNKDSMQRRRTNRLENTEWENLNPHWRPVSDIYKGDFLVSPIKMGGDIKVPKPFAFLTGVFMAEGSFEKYKGSVSATVLTIGTKEVKFRKAIMSACNKLGFKYSISHHKVNQSTNIRIAGRFFAEKMLELCGDYAHLKSMKGDLRKWDKESLKWFLGGYIEGDGSIDKYYRLRFRCRTASKSLANDIWQTFLSLGIRAFVNKDGQPYEKSYVCPRYNKVRVLKCKGSYAIKAVDIEGLLNNYTITKKNKTACFDRDRKTYDRIILTDKYVLMPVMSIKHKVKEDEVFNFEVDTDHSYVAGNICAHNCNQDPTKAKGIILSSILKSMPGSHGNLIKNIQLLAFDRNRDPALANAILSGERKSYSMGALTRDYRTTCCGALATKGGCEHLQNPNGGKIVRLKDGRLGYWQTVDPNGFENSSVQTPAFPCAENPNYINMGE